MKDKQFGVPIEARAQYTILFTMLRLLGDDGVARNIPVASRDINEILRNMPNVAAEFPNIFCYDFHDVVKISIEIDGKWTALDEIFGASNSARHFLPDKGQVYHLKDIKDDDNSELLFLRSVMQNNNEASCFLNKTNKISFFNLENGDKVLDYSDITALDLRSLIKPSVEKDEVSEDIPEEEKPDKTTLN